MVKKTFYKTKDYCKVKFTLETEGAEKIVILGLEDNWQKPVKLKKKKDGSFSTDLNLPKGSRHEFRYLVNGTDWMNEPAADGEVPNMYGGTNSLLTL